MNAKRSVAGRVVVALIAVACLPAFASAGPITFRFDAVVTSVDGGSFPVSEVAVIGDKVVGSFGYEMFEDPAGQVSRRLNLTIGDLDLSTAEYRYAWSDNGSGLLPPNPHRGDGVTLLATDDGDGFLTVAGSEFAWRGSVALAGGPDLFANSPVAEIASPAVAMSQLDTWRGFEVGELQIVLVDASGLGPSSTVVASISPATFSVVPEPASFAAMLLCGGIATTCRCAVRERASVTS